MTTTTSSSSFGQLWSFSQQPSMSYSSPSFPSKSSPSRTKKSFLIVLAILFALSVITLLTSSSSFVQAAGDNSLQSYKTQNLEMEYNVKSKVNPNNKEYAYCTLVSSVSYLMGALAMYKSILAQGGEHDLVLVVTGKQIADIINNIESYRSDPLVSRVRIFIASYITNPNEKIPEVRFTDTYNKLHVWKLDQYGYKRLVFIDSDCIVFKNVDILFNCVGPICSGSDMGNNEFFNGGMMVFEPSTKTFEDMISKMGNPAYKSYDGGEQGYLNLYFSFPYKTKSWDLERELDEATTEEDKKAVIAKYQGESRLWRLPYTWNTEIPMYYFFRYAWGIRLKQTVQVVHFNLPIKPWVFLSFPVLDGSYFWYQYVTSIPQFSYLPASLVAIFIGEILLLIFGLSMSKTLFPILLSTIMPENCLVDSIHFKLVRTWTNLKNKKSVKRPITTYQNLKKTILLLVWPISAVAVTAFVTFIIYFKLVSDASYDPHVQWLALLSLVATFSVVIMSFYQQFIKVQTKQCIQSNFDQSQLSLTDTTLINDKIIPYFFLYQIAAIVLPIVDFFLVVGFIYLTMGAFLFHVTVLVVYAIIHLLLIGFVLKNFARQTIYSTFKELLRVQ